MDGPKRHKVDGLRKWTVQKTKVDGPQKMKLDGPKKCVGGQKGMKVGGPLSGPSTFPFLDRPVTNENVSFFKKEILDSRALVTKM